MINLTYAYYTVTSAVAFALIMIALWYMWNSWPVVLLRFRLKRRIKKAIKDRLILYHGRDAALKKAVKKAQKLHANNGKRYRVFFLDGRYRVYDRDEIKNNKKDGTFNKYINSTSIDPIKFFDTNDIQPCS